MSEVKVDKISPKTGTSMTVGDSGDTFTVPSGATLTVAGALNVTGTTSLADGTVNVAEIDIDGATDIGEAIVDADLFVVDNGAGGTNRKTAASRLKTYILGNNSVDSDAYVDGSIDLAHMSVNSIDSDQYVDGSIDLAHMSVNSIDSDQYVDGSIDTAHIGALQVTGAKLAADVISAQTALTAEPADTDEFMVSDAGVLKRIDYSLIKGGGITESETWRMNTSLNSSATTAALTANWEIDDTYGNVDIGTGMTESSGVFSFPSTGIWLIHYGISFQNDNGSLASKQTGGAIYVTTDNSNYYDAAAAYNCNDREVSNVFTSVHMSKILDVTNVSNVKCKFYYKLQQAFAVRGITSSNETYVNFIRLGDT